MFVNKFRRKISNIDVWLSRIVKVSIIIFVIFYISWMLWDNVSHIEDTNILGFFGSIIGGFIGGILTLLGVIKTINQGQKDKFINEFGTKLKYFKQLLMEIEIFNTYEFDNLVVNDHVKRMTIDELDIRKEINSKFEKIKDIAASIDTYTYYLIESYEEFIVNEFIYYYEEVRQYDLKMIKERKDPDEDASELRYAIMDLFEELYKKKMIFYWNYINIEST